MNDLLLILKLTIITVFVTLGLIIYILTNSKNTEPEMAPYCDVVFQNDLDYQKKELLQHSGLKVFQKCCKSCHSLDRMLVGSPLRGIFEKRDSLWLVKMIINATELIDSGDTIALNLFNDYGQITHPVFESLDEKELVELIEYLKLEGQ